jgi:glycosyltransferase involved in cell wall biosynthesis
MALITPIVRSSDGRVVFSGSTVEAASGRIVGIKPDALGTARRVVLNPGAPDATDAEYWPWLTAACLVVHRTLWEALAGFDDRFFLYWEDVDLSYRAQRLGARLVVRTDLVAVHDEGGTQGTRRGRAKSTIYYRFNTRNRLAFAARHLSGRTLRGWILATPAQSWAILMRGGRRQLLHSPRPLAATIAGAAGGLAVALSADLSARAQSVRTARADRTDQARQRPSPPRVLVAHPGSELYGSDRVLVESVRALVQAGYRVVAALPYDGPLVRELERAGAAVQFCRSPVLRKSALRPSGAARLILDAVSGIVPAVRMIRRHAHDGLYVNTVTIPLWLLLGRTFRRRVVCHVHEAERGVPMLVQRLMAMPLYCANAVVANSRFSLDVLAQAAPTLRERSVVIYNGIAGPPQVTAARPAITGPVRLLYIGRLSPRKGPQVAVAAAGLLRSRGVEVELDLVGAVFEGYEWFEKELRAEVAAQSLGDHVRFNGFIDNVWPLVAECDIVLIPSVVDEPFGNTAVEAVLAARPLVVSAFSGLLEAAAGYQSVQSVRPGAADEIADAVQTVLAGWEQYRLWALADQAIARDRHDRQSYGEQIVTVVRGR